MNDTFARPLSDVDRLQCSDPAGGGVPPDVTVR